MMSDMWNLVSSGVDGSAGDVAHAGATHGEAAAGAGDGERP